MKEPGYPAVLDLMLCVWNESDRRKVSELCHKALTDNVEFIDPSVVARGIDEFERNVHEVRKRLPHAVYSRVSAVDCHNGFYRYYWAIHIDNKLVTQGFDVAEVHDGKVCSVLGFFGDLPLNAPL